MTAKTKRVLLVFDPAGIVHAAVENECGEPANTAFCGWPTFDDEGDCLVLSGREVTCAECERVLKERS